jgi:transposase
MPRRRRYRRWDAEEKRSICLQARAPGVSVAQVARRHALNANLIFKWLKDPRLAPADAVEAATVLLPVDSCPCRGRRSRPSWCGSRPPPGSGSPAPSPSPSLPSPPDFVTIS